MRKVALAPRPYPNIVVAANGGDVSSGGFKDALEVATLPPLHNGHADGDEPADCPVTTPATAAAAAAAIQGTGIRMTSECGARHLNHSKVRKHDGWTTVSAHEQPIKSILRPARRGYEVQRGKQAFQRHMVFCIQLETSYFRNEWRSC